MRIKFFLTASALAFAAAFVTVSANAGEGVGGALHDFADGVGADNVGGAISGEIYGNTSNPRPSGNGVLPSLSPGPWVCAGADCSAQPSEAGGSMGDFISPATSGGKSSSNFSRDKSPGPDFSKGKYD